ncbi:MAG TPA: hypothetical protein PKU86_00810 [Bacteroidales bacterium]|nr:hypothetical protein [Bacteroidales bacterium]
MSNWLEDAERHAQRGNGEEQSERLKVRIDRVKENYEKNAQTYNAFINSIKGLVNRANALPAEYRVPFGRIKHKTKQTRLNNYLNIFSSSRRIRLSSKKGLLGKLFPTHYKHIRVIFISVSKHLDRIDLEIKEDMLERKRMNEDGHTGKPHRKNEKERTDLLIHLDFKLLNEELAQKIIDYLAFKCEVKQIPLPFDEAIYF